MDCEKLIHGNRDFKPFPKYYKLDENGKKVPADQETFPYKCERPAVCYKVSGASFSTTATLCTTHKKAAEREGFKLEPLFSSTADRGTQFR